MSEQEPNIFDGMELFVGPPAPPEKVPGEHFWVVMLSVAATPMPRGDDPEQVDVAVSLTAESIVREAGPGCLWCEGFYPHVVNTPCPGERLGGD